MHEEWIGIRFNLNSDLLRLGKVVPGVGGGMGCIGSGGEGDHGGLSGGAHREPQEQRAAPLLCVGRSYVIAPVRTLFPRGWIKRG